MNTLGICLTVAVIILFVVYCLMDTAQKADDNADRQAAAGFARFETRSPGLTDVDDCAGKDCRTCETLCATGIERLR